MSAQRGRRPRARVVSRDGLSFVGGWYLMIYQSQFATTFNLTVFLGGMVIAGIPGTAQAFSLWLSARTPPPSSPSPESASSGASRG